jgi:hypothetical protein
LVRASPRSAFDPSSAESGAHRRKRPKTSVTKPEKTVKKFQFLIQVNAALQKSCQLMIWGKFSSLARAFAGKGLR